MARCLCLMSPPTAGLVIGWLSAALSLIQSVICIVIIASRDAVMVYVGVPTGRISPDVSSIQFGLTLVSSIVLVISLLDVLASVLLMIGSLKNVHMALLPWLFHNGVLLVIKILSNSYILILLATYASYDDYNTSDRIWCCVLGFIILGFWCWAWSTIWSLFGYIRSRKNSPLDLNNKIYSSDSPLVECAEPINVDKFVQLPESEH